jgi:hypothetical protein
MRKIILIVLLTIICFQMNFAAPTVALRRPISPNQPMWLIHIDTWNYPDPQKIIDMIPKDIRPYVVMNISLSINHDSNTGEMLTCPYGYETARSWLRTCAENKIWATVQCASGGFSHFSETDLRIYEEFFRDYPNFLGWNYAEQFWGFDDKYSCSYPQRLAHFTELMKLADKYGGYLIVSFCGEWYGSSLNPVAMMKRDANFAAVCKEHPEHLILCEKYTQQTCFYDMESVCFGSFISGVNGNYGIRFDQCGWVAESSTESTFPVAAGAAPVFNNMMLNGGTVTDGPELIWQQCFKENNAGTTSDGYTARRWSLYPQFSNISIDMFRKILDKTVRIPTRDEVIKRTKVAIIDDINSGTDNWTDYASPSDLYDGLYNMDDTKHMQDDTTWFKKTGRYPTIPTVAFLSDSLAQSLPVQVKRSAYSSRWGNKTNKVAEFNQLFTQEYTGDAYASRIENAWLTYNPYKTDRTASAVIPLKYNTCDSLKLTYSEYTTGVVKEFADSLTFYLTNYRVDITALKNDTLKIYGSKTEPTYYYRDRASHTASKIVKAEWVDSVYTIVVAHNGPLDLTIKCSGDAKDRLTEFTEAKLLEPEIPSEYVGARQYEAENFDYKNIGGNVTNGNYGSIKNYSALGYLNFGTNSAAVVRDTVSVLHDGDYTFTLRYLAPNGIGRILLYVNNVRSQIISLPMTTTANGWTDYTCKITLNAGKNVIRINSNSNQNSLYFDRMTIDDGSVQNIKTLDISRYSLADFNVSTGEDSVQTVYVTGRGLTSPVTVNAPDGFEVSLSSDADYSSSLIINSSNDGAITDSAVYVRIKPNGAVGTYTGMLTFTSDGIPEQSITLNGIIKPASVSLVYDFTADEAITTSSTPPAKDITAGSVNSTAGVVSYTDLIGTTSNMLKIYSASQRNASGVLNLNKFTSKSTDYSVTWRQCNGLANTDYKAGVLLRGDDNVVGNSSKGYTEGMKAGYAFIVYNHPSSSNTEFRIYKSTESVSLNMLVNSSASVNPSVKQSMWYRASVSGSSSTVLKLEYSTDGVTWVTGSSTTDLSGSFQSGSTQFVWGLAASQNNFFVDDISFNGTTYDQTITSINTSSANAYLISTEYYNIAGLRMNKPEHGIIIEKMNFSDGSVKTKKILMK